jgi:kynurenine formamidase
VTLDFREVGKKYSNWGRWGDDDEKGTINFITNKERAHAATLAKTGKLFSLTLTFGSGGPQTGTAGRINPVHTMTATGHGQDFPGGFKYADDFIYMPLQAATQWDSLCHVYYDGQLYNGYSSDNVRPDGAWKDSIEKIHEGIVGRGVLLDIPRFRGVDRLENGEIITSAELQNCADKQGVEIRPGDILLTRTGWMLGTKDNAAALRDIHGEPGIGLEAVPWLHEKQVAVIAADNIAVEVAPGPEEGATLPAHCVLIRDLGMTLGEWFWLDDLAEDCAQDGVYEFLFTGAPLKFERAVGSPVNPLVIK